VWIVNYASSRRISSFNDPLRLGDVTGIRVSSCQPPPHNTVIVFLTGCRLRSARPRHRLVVDDNVDAASSIADLLRLDGHEVCVVHTAHSALERFPTFRPDVVLLDIGLPRLVHGHSDLA
jgi:hypothetical protein